MSTDQNKAVVRRFMTEVLEGGDLGVFDELVAPDYVNPAMGGADRAAFKAILTTMRAGGIAMHFDIQGLVADGDGVVARFESEITRGDGQKSVAHGLTYYRLVDGRIAEDDPFTRPDLAQLLGMQPPAS